MHIKYGTHKTKILQFIFFGGGGVLDYFSAFY